MIKGFKIKYMSNTYSFIIIHWKENNDEILVNAVEIIINEGSQKVIDVIFV
jgi:hypothetical protein